MAKKKRDRKLGVAERQGRYDLPLQSSAGTKFLTLLIALMSFLAMLALSGSFALNNLTRQWSSGLENQATIEIPAMDSKGSLRNAETLDKLTDKAAAALENNINVQDIKLLSEEEIHDLVAPWLGESIPKDSIPLPRLISIKIKESTEAQIKKIRSSLSGVSEDIQLDTHQGWLEDILRLADSLKLSGSLITLIIALTTVLAIAGAVRSRMAEHRADVELLHLMGASNDYISRQFQRHTLIIALKGSIIGVVGGGFTLTLFSFLSHSDESSLMPKVPFNLAEIFVLLCLPALACLIAFLTARFTVLRTLSLMP